MGRKVIEGGYEREEMSKRGTRKKTKYGERRESGFERQDMSYGGTRKKQRMMES